MASELYIPRTRDDDEVSLISMRELAPSPIGEDEFDGFYIPSGASTPSLQKSQTLPPPPRHTLAIWRSSPFVFPPLEPELG